MKKQFTRFAKLALFFTFLVTLAGSVVRMTGSGMGCPDWPRCFGYYIPPSNPAQLDFHPEHDYRKGMMIIKNDTLWRALNDFRSGNGFDHANWEKYPKHDYAKFVVAHTWTEYINRLSGATMGLVVLGLFITSFVWYREKPLLTMLSTGMLLLTGFQAWLGALVVSSHLAPVKITIHMLAVLVLLVLIQLILKINRQLQAPIQNAQAHQIATSQPIVFTLRNWFLLALLLTTVQIVLGTEVREAIDQIASNAGNTGRETWVNQLPFTFYIHRSFSILLLLINGWLLIKARQSGNQRTGSFALIAICILVMEVLAGIILSYADFPAIVQPLHLLLGLMLFAAQFECWLSLGKDQISESPSA